MRTRARLRWIPLCRPGDAYTPAITRSESPGRKKPTSRPVSAKMIAIRPSVPNVAIRWCGDMAPHTVAAGSGLTADPRHANRGKHCAQIPGHRREPGEGEEDLRVPRPRLRRRGLLRARPRPAAG